MAVCVLCGKSQADQLLDIVLDDVPPDLRDEILELPFRENIPVHALCYDLAAILLTAPTKNGE